MIYDFIIVGSGVSGARFAEHLTQAGANTLMLEAGPYLSTKDLGMEEVVVSSKCIWGGGAELTQEGVLGLLRGKCWGGTSTINQALLDRFDSMAWEEWRDQTQVDLFDFVI